MRGKLLLVEMFAGIGGLTLGLERALNARTVVQAERDSRRRQVLRSQFPHAVQCADVSEVLGIAQAVEAERLVLAGGFPCRGASSANLTGARGMSHPETGLWTVMAAFVRQVRPMLVVVENVVALRVRGLDTVLKDLDGAGYDVLWGTLSASAHGAPHERERMFILGRRRGVQSEPGVGSSPDPRWWPWEEAIPPNDHDAPGQRLRVSALGDAVLPAVAYSVGLIACDWLVGRDYAVEQLRESDELPTAGIASQGRRFKLVAPASVWRPSQACAAQHWVVVDERFSVPTKLLYECVTAPALGRVYYEHGDAFDVELPGGAVEYFPAEWVRTRPWPTPMAADGKNLGGQGQYNRNAVPLNALAQHDAWDEPDELGACHIINGWQRGVGPGLVEWMMGFPHGYTAPMA